MPRLASLFLPDLAIDRIRRIERIVSPPESSPALAGEGDRPQRSEGAVRARSSPRAPGFRPGARWVWDEEVRQSNQASAAEALVTTHRIGQRITVAAACPTARALGLAPGMALTQARLLVPGLEVRDADPQGDAAFLDRFGTFAARHWTPRAAVSGGDGLWLDLSGVAHLFGGEKNLCRRLIGFCARLDLSARIAVAGTTGAAHALARFGRDPITLVAAGREAEALAPLPLAALRLDQESLAAARRLGLETISQLIAMPRGPLQRRFGAELLIRFDQAMGRAAEPFDPIIPEEPPSVLLRLLEPIASAEVIREAIGEAIRRLVPELERAGLGVRRLVLACERVDGIEQRMTIGTARATRDGDHLRRLLEPRIETIDPGFGIERMRLAAARVEPLGAQPVEGLLAGERQPPDLVPLIDRLAGRLGPRRLYRLSAVESDVPERSARRTDPLAPTTAWPRWPRPIRLLSPPERIDDVVALLPDQPPRRFRWRGRSHRVVQADGPERIHGEWWKRPCEVMAVRDYFQVEDEEGRRFWLFRRGDGQDKRTGDLSWYVHGVFG